MTTRASHDPLNQLYDEVAAGRAVPPKDYNEFKRMLARARHAARRGTPQERADAVTVVGAIGGHWALTVLREFTADEAPEVRRKALDVAVAEGEAGLTILRDLAVDPEPEISLLALDYLQRAVDRGSAGRMRSLLTAADPRQRAAAARLLGSISGPGLIVPLRRALDAEPDETVKAALVAAMARIDGEEPREEPDPWWADPAAQAEEWAPLAPLDALPEPLPADDPGALLALLGRAQPAHREVLMTALREHDFSTLSRAVRALRPDGEPERAIGACRAAELMEEERWIVPLRRLLPDRDPGVRIAVAEALSIIGKASVVMGLRDLLSDPVPAVPPRRPARPPRRRR